MMPFRKKIKGNMWVFALPYQVTVKKMLKQLTWQWFD